MAVFSYKALDSELRAVDGIVVGDTPREARDQLRSRGLSVERLSPVAERPEWMADWLSGRLILRRRRHEAQVVSMIRELATLLGAGLPVVEALDTIARQQKGRFRAVLLTLRDRIASGASLAEAMAQQPEVFDEFCVRMTEVGEQSGTLEGVMLQLAEFKQRMTQLKNRVATALMYPLIVLAVGVGVSVFLMTFVVPNLLETLTDAGRPLPAITVAVKTGSDLLITKWWLLIGVAVLCLAGVGALRQSRRGRLEWDRWQLRLPLIGDLARKQAVARIAVVVSTLMRSGVEFVHALQIAQRATRNLILREALQRCEDAVHAGRDIHEALEETGAFPPTVVQVFAVGQSSGRLEEMLDRLASEYDQQVNLATSRLTALLEPVLILLLAVVVGTIAFATILPILEAGNVL